ncbi:hypothetical protein MKX01_026921 [Papaver californicum]|nr:hypothetical protein MKX01_026921 [Papaver californicum]
MRISERRLIDVPAQLQTQLPRRTPFHVLPQVEDDSSLIDVPIQTELPQRSSHVLPQVEVGSSLIDVPIQVVRNIPHEEADDILRAPLGTFNASASTSSTRKKPRRSHSRRVRFTPIVLPRSPEVRAALRAFNAARIRAIRNQNRTADTFYHPILKKKIPNSGGIQFYVSPQVMHYDNEGYVHLIEWIKGF